MTKKKPAKAKRARLPAKSSIGRAVEQAAAAALQLAALKDERKRALLLRFAELIWERRDFLLKENARDLKREERALAPALYARLKLDEAKIRVISDGTREIANTDDPVHRTIERLELDSGLVLEKRTVPIGVIAVIFESRPDVIPQILALFLKSGNAGLLKGGREAKNSNLAFMSIVAELNKEFDCLPAGWAQLFLERSDVDQILRFEKFVNLVIPRGSNELVQSIMKRTKIPVLGHADGVCHIYWDASADFDLAKKVIVDAKTQYPAVCNAVETLLVHRDNVKQLGVLLAELETLGVEIFGDGAIRKILPSARPVRDWHTEYGDLRMAVRLVDSTQAAIAHMNEHGSHHTDGILADDSAAIEEFLAGVDSASLVVNASTRFADGYRFGMGAEVGISTNKTHARGPVGLDGLVIHQYILRGHGHVVKDYVGPNAKRYTHRKL